MNAQSRLFIFGNRGNRFRSGENRRLQDSLVLGD